MESQKGTPSFRPFFFPALTMFVTGWGGLAILLIFTQPFVWWRWTFFILWLLALTGSALPVTYFLYRRFSDDPTIEPYVILRQAIWFGVYGAVLAWLQLGRLVTPMVIFGLAAGLFMIEFLIRMRERSRWRPSPPPESSDHPPVNDKKEHA